MTKQKNTSKYEFKGYLQSKKTIINNQSFNYLYVIKNETTFNVYRYEDEILLYFENDLTDKASLYFVFNLYEFILPLLPQLQRFYKINVLAQNSVSWYSVDLVDYEDKTKIRIWDVSFMRDNNLDSWADAVSIKRLNYDETIIRNKETSLTEHEIKALKQNFDIIEKYLQSICEVFSCVKFEDFGVKVFTKTSLTRLYMSRVAGVKSFETSSGRKRKYITDFHLQCQSEKFKSYEEYATAKACFRGGLSFTSEVCASRLLKRVKEIDMCSCYHACMLAHRVPIKWKHANNNEIEELSKYIQEFTYKDILNIFSNPFHLAFNAKFSFKNLKRKEESCFGLWRIATLASEKFQTKRININEKLVAEDEYARNNGFIDSGKHLDFLFSKLVYANECDLFLTELEFWILYQVYDFENYEVQFGYVSYQSIKPPSLIALSSFNLYEYKDKLKKVNKQENSIKSQEDYNFIKAVFNSLYGVQVQSPFYPNYYYDDKLKLDDNTVICLKNFDELNEQVNYKNMFNYGLRVSGWSRVHLIIALLLLYENFDITSMCVSGDTDSLFLQTDKSMDEVLKILEPLHKATQKSIIQLTNRVRKSQHLNNKEYIKHVGFFESEFDNLQWDYELWNKARILYTKESKVKITLAGVPQLTGDLSISNFIENKLNENTSSKTIDILQNILNYNTEIDTQLTGSCSFEDVKLLEKIDDIIVDYQGNSEYIVCYATCWQKPQNLVIGDSSKFMNFRNVCELERQHIDVDNILKEKIICLEDNKIIVKDENENKIL